MVRGLFEKIFRQNVKKTDPDAKIAEKQRQQGQEQEQRKATAAARLSGDLISMLFRVGKDAYNRSPSLQHAFSVYCLLSRRSKALVRVLPYSSLPFFRSGYSSSFLLSVVFTLVLVILTIRYLHNLHAKSDMTRKRELRLFRVELKEKLSKLNCSPIMLRLAWSDSASFDKSIREWPLCGGATGSIRFDRERKCRGNTGIDKAIDIIQEVKFRFKTVSWADAIQMAGALAVEVTGGPIIPMRYGRIDAPDAVAPRLKNKERSSESATAPVLSLRLPSAIPPFPDNAPSADVHIRTCFYRMGFNNRDIVALCGAHTIGRAFEDRSGSAVCPYSTGDQGATIYTRSTSTAKGDGSLGVGMAGGCSWTTNWLHFDNSYFKRNDAENNQLLWLPTDKALKECPEFRKHFLRYAEDQDAFFADYIIAHRKMSDNGSNFSPKLGLVL